MQKRHKLKLLQNLHWTHNLKQRNLLLYSSNQLLCLSELNHLIY